MLWRRYALLFLWLNRLKFARCVLLCLPARNGEPKTANSIMKIFSTWYLKMEKMNEWWNEYNVFPCGN